MLREEVLRVDRLLATHPAEESGLLPIAGCGVILRTCSKPLFSLVMATELNLQSYREYEEESRESGVM
jgi:hypothetical protein